MNEELIEVVTENGDVIKVVPRSEIHGDPSLLHKVIHVLVFNSNSELLLQKRSMSKNVAPGKWDTSVGGHVNAGENLEEAVMREMEEELGINKDVPVYLYSYIHSNPFETELVYTYKCIYDGEINFQQDEIDEVRYWSIDEIKKSIGRGTLSDNFEHEFRVYVNHCSK
ncbi:MAG: NUDIX domain-containing protein [Nitrospiraceae bacterium]|nr:MAG: NUDIX domain-containing protein [Nitrospiraceae bacterium]